MSLINKVIFRNFKNEITKDNSKENESKLNVKLYPGFQQSMEEIRFKKNDEEMTGWFLKQKFFAKAIN